MPTIPPHLKVAPATPWDAQPMSALLMIIDEAFRTHLLTARQERQLKILLQNNPCGEVEQQAVDRLLEALIAGEVREANPDPKELIPQAS
ncbi:MAG: hypothetical protein NW237_10705 [Cyanobacteriota bacterium]|nr:hypothetical protein [Cyanobacteriota bacterium]